MTSMNNNSGTTSEAEKPKRLIDHIDLLQKAKNLSDQQIAEKLGLKEAKNLELLRTGLFIPSMSILANICSEMGWDISDGLVALSSDRDLDLNFNIENAMKPFRLKNYEDLINAHEEIKSGNKSLIKLSSNGVGVIMFSEK